MVETAEELWQALTPEQKEAVSGGGGHVGPVHSDD